MAYLNPQKLTDQKQIRPITPELFTILVDLERRDLSTPVQWIYLRAKVLELLALQLENYRKELPETKDGYGSVDLRKLYQVRKKITDHLHMNFSLARLAAEAGINPKLLNEEFHQVFGLSVHEFRTRAKMERARQLLARSDRLIYQIAEAVGYKNSTHFSAAFKRNFGKTPKQYRNSL
jgi:AraC-like DNA-binding protein